MAKINIKKTLIWLLGLLAAFPVVLLLLYIVFGINSSQNVWGRSAVSFILAVCLTPLIGITNEVEK